MDEVEANFVDIATDSKGSTFVQKCLPEVNGEAMQRMVMQTIFCALILAEHHYGFVFDSLKFALYSIYQFVFNQPLLGI